MLVLSEVYLYYFCLSSPLSVSNAMHGQNIHLPVCVCPSHFLSTRLQVITVDSLKDADLCKDVPFGGLDDE